MLLLIFYVVIALGFSFLCSIAEAVILSVSSAYISVLEKEGRPSGALLRKQTDNINTPLSAILTLNTIAHTMGAAGAGAQAAAVFGEAYLGVISAVLTLLILVFSEIIPKTLGATYWRGLAPATANTRSNGAFSPFNPAFGSNPRRWTTTSATDMAIIHVTASPWLFGRSEQEAGGRQGSRARDAGDFVQIL